MILNREREWVIAQADLLDDVIVRTPSFNFKPVGEAIDRLMV